MVKTVGIIGLGLIGGSMAKALKAKTNCTVVGYDLSDQVLSQALADGAIDQARADMAQIDFLLVALYPGAAIASVKEAAPKLKKGCIIVDLCGVKQALVQELDEFCKTQELIYIGGHPMAGREFSGYAYSLPSLFEGASMILTPTPNAPRFAIEEARMLFSALGFIQVVETSAQDHDRMIAFTSQLAHVVSSAYIKSPEADRHQGYSAGSYKDLTRVAKLNEDMWTELFLLNKGPLVDEIDTLVQHLIQYRDAIAQGDAKWLNALLKDGRERKERVG